MKTIYHYKIAPAEGWQTLRLTEGARPIHYEGIVGGKLWVILDTDAPPKDIHVAVIGTGWEIPDGAEYVCTHIGATGYVWHVFWRPDSEGER